MDGMLSQDEINALLSGMSLDDAPAEAPVVEAAAEESVSQEALTDIEKDAVGEVANISMGSSATTLYSLVNRKVNITTPVVTITTWPNLIKDYEKPCVFIQIKYTAGLDGSNILVLKEHDVKIITDLMMGGDGTNTDGDLSELHLSAISEAMNQMMGAAATSLSSMLAKMIDISPPVADLLETKDFETGSDRAEFLQGEFVKVAFRMQIGDLVDSTILQLYPMDFAKELCAVFLGQMDANQAPAPEPTPAAPEPQPYIPPQATPMDAYAQPQPMDMGMAQMGMPQMGMPQMGMPQMGMPQMGMPQMGMPQMGMPQMGMPQMMMPQMQPINVQPAQFQNFTPTGPISGQENIGLIMDVPLEVTVELGRTSKSIADILDMAPGTIIELDKIAGEPIDILVNGKFVAKGEVVVIEESFGVRVTEIIK